MDEVPAAQLDPELSLADVDRRFFDDVEFD